MIKSPIDIDSIARSISASSPTSYSQRIHSPSNTIRKLIRTEGLEDAVPYGDILSYYPDGSEVTFGFSSSSDLVTIDYKLGPVSVSIEKNSFDRKNNECDFTIGVFRLRFMFDYDIFTQIEDYDWKPSSVNIDLKKDFPYILDHDLFNEFSESSCRDFANKINLDMFSGLLPTSFIDSFSNELFSETYRLMSDSGLKINTELNYDDFSMDATSEQLSREFDATEKISAIVSRILEFTVPQYVADIIVTVFAIINRCINGELLLDLTLITF